MAGSAEGSAARWWTLSAACLAVFALLVNVTIVSVALPDLARGLDAGFTAQRWVVSGYTAALATLLLGSGSLADLLGHRRVFLAGLWLFLLASAACGVAGSAEVLVAARIAQGGAAALLFSTSLVLIADAFPGQERAKALGLWAATVGVATSVGPLFGGALVELGSWRWIFFVNVPVLLPVVALVAFRVTPDAVLRRAPVDWRGQGVVAVALFLLVFALSEGGERGWGSGLVVGALAGGALLLGAFVSIERRVRHPMLDLGLLRRRGTLGAGIAGFSMHAFFFTTFVFFAIYLQTVLGYSAIETGLALLPSSAANAVAGALAGRVASRLDLGARVAAGLAMVGVGILLIHGLATESSWTALLAGSVAGGAGVGLANPAIAGAALAAAERARAGIASALNVTFRQLGTAAGIAALGTLLQAHAQERAADLMGAAERPAVAAAQLTAVGSEERASVLAPAGTEPMVMSAGHEAFASALNEVLLVCALGIGVGLVVSYVLLRGLREPMSGSAAEAPLGAPRPQ